VCFGFWFWLLSQCIFVCIFFIDFCHYPVRRCCFYYSLSPWINAPKFSTPLHNSSFSSSNNILFWACFGSFFLNFMLAQLFLQGFQSISVLFFYALLKLCTGFRSIFVLPQLLAVLLTVLSPLDSYIVFF
jgi:hypothetical protein